MSKTNQSFNPIKGHFCWNRFVLLWLQLSFQLSDCLRLTVLPPSFLIRRLALNHICHLPNPLSVSNTFDKSFGVRLNIQYMDILFIEMVFSVLHTNDVDDDGDWWWFVAAIFCNQHVKLVFFSGNMRQMCMFVCDFGKCSLIPIEIKVTVSLGECTKCS